MTDIQRIILSPSFFLPLLHPIPWPDKLLKINMRRRASKWLQISLSFWSAACLFVKCNKVSQQIREKYFLGKKLKSN